MESAKDMLWAMLAMTMTMMMPFIQGILFSMSSGLNL
jgi:hypothetical protein